MGENENSKKRREREGQKNKRPNNNTNEQKIQKCENEQKEIYSRVKPLIRCINEVSKRIKKRKK
jgi:hypothetical protein